MGNVDFYTAVLGLRLVKTTVNFDDPGTYHLYYGDEAGRPSTILTFFPGRHVDRGRQGTGLTTATAFSIPPGSLGWWQRHLAEHGADVVDPPRDRDAAGAAEEVLTFRDPDGLVIDLVASPGDTRSGWDGVAAIPAEHAVRGLHSVTLTERDLDPTASMLTGLLGMNAEGGRRPRPLRHGGCPGRRSRRHRDDRCAGGPAGRRDRAPRRLRAPDGETQERWRAQLVDAGLEVTPILDRQYFTSIYFREPGGVLFEIATDRPGFDVDEPLLELGRHLKLPPWLEPTREQIEESLPPLRLGDGVVEGTGRASV